MGANVPNRSKFDTCFNFIHCFEHGISKEWTSLVHGKNTYECHTGDIRVHTSDIRMTCEWHTDDIRLHTSDIQMTYEWYTSTYDWHVNDWRNIKLHNGFGAFRLLFLTICVKNTALYWFKRFLSLGCSYSHTFCLNIPKFNYRFWKPE